MNQNSINYVKTTSKQVKKIILKHRNALVLKETFVFSFRDIFYIKALRQWCACEYNDCSLCLYSYFLMKCWGEGVCKINDMHFIQVHESTNNTEWFLPIPVI